MYEVLQKIWLLRYCNLKLIKLSNKFTNFQIALTLLVYYEILKM